MYGQLQSGAAAMVKIAAVLDERARDPREAARARAAARSRATSPSTTSSSRTASSRCCTASTSTCRRARCLALVGESGGGKSTLARLVGRFYDPDQGAVRVDGVDLRDVKLRSYRRQIGVVLQDPFLFSGTIASNIRFAKPDATDEEVGGRGPRRRRRPRRRAALRAGSSTRCARAAPASRPASGS